MIAPAPPNRQGPALSRTRAAFSRERLLDNSPVTLFEYPPVPPGSLWAFYFMPSSDPFYAGLGQAIRLGTELLAALIVGGALGWLADTYLFASGPWGLVVGLILGAVAGVLNAYRAAQRWSQP